MRITIDKNMKNAYNGVQRTREVVEPNLVILWRIPCMEKIPMYLNDKEIARKITECVSSATGNDIQEHNLKNSDA